MVLRYFHFVYVMYANVSTKADRGSGTNSKLLKLASGKILIVKIYFHWKSLSFFMARSDVESG